MLKGIRDIDEREGGDFWDKSPPSHVLGELEEGKKRTLS